MNKITIESLSTLSKYLILLLITLLIEGKYRISIINNYFIDYDYIHILKLSSNINMLISSLFIIIVLMIILSACCFTSEIFNLKISTNSIIQAFISVALTFTFFQLFKLIIDIIFLEGSYVDITDESSLIKSLKNTEWFKYISIADYLMVTTSTIVLFITMYLQEKKQNLFSILILTSIFLICYFIVLL